MPDQHTTETPFAPRSLRLPPFAAPVNSAPPAAHRTRPGFHRSVRALFTPPLIATNAAPSPAPPALVPVPQPPKAEPERIAPEPEMRPMPEAEAVAAGFSASSLDPVPTPAVEAPLATFEDESPAVDALPGHRWHDDTQGLEADADEWQMEPAAPSQLPVVQAAEDDQPLPGPMEDEPSVTEWADADHVVAGPAGDNHVEREALEDQAPAARRPWSAPVLEAVGVTSNAADELSSALAWPDAPAAGAVDANEIPVVAADQALASVAGELQESAAPWARAGDAEQGAGSDAWSVSMLAEMFPDAGAMVAEALERIAQRIREGDVTISRDAATATDAGALAAVLAALLRR